MRPPASGVPSDMARPALTRSRIVAAGMAIVSELGFTALTLRAVARRVNATTTGVQRQIGATELVESVVAEIMSSMPAVPTRGDWARRLRLWAIHTRAWLMEYPGLARYLLVNRWEAYAALDRLEQVVSVLESADLAPAQQVAAGTTLYWFVLSRTDLDESARIIGSELSVKQVVETPERWPELSAHMGEHSAAAAQAHFTFGLDLLLEGIDHRSRKDAVRPSVSAGRTSGTSVRN
jgi:AcrR family transcriptional regulator